MCGAHGLRAHEFQLVRQERAGARLQPDRSSGARPVRRARQVRPERRGRPGAQGLQGPIGPSDVYSALHRGLATRLTDGERTELISVSLPAGNYMITANAVLGSADPSVTQYAECSLSTGDLYGYGLGPFEQDMRVLTTTMSLASPGTVTFYCRADNATASGARIYAIKVGDLH